MCILGLPRRSVSLVPIHACAFVCVCRSRVLWIRLSSSPFTCSTTQNALLTRTRCETLDSPIRFLPSVLVHSFTARSRCMVSRCAFARHYAPCAAYTRFCCTFCALAFVAVFVCGYDSVGFATRGCLYAVFALVAPGFAYVASCCADPVCVHGPTALPARTLRFADFTDCRFVAFYLDVGLHYLLRVCCGWFPDRFCRCWFLFTARGFHGYLPFVHRVLLAAFVGSHTSTLDPVGPPTSVLIPLSWLLRYHGYSLRFFKDSSQNLSRTLKKKKKKKHARTFPAPRFTTPFRWILPVGYSAFAAAFVPRIVRHCTFTFRAFIKRVRFTRLRLVAVAAHAAFRCVRWIIIYAVCACAFVCAFRFRTGCGAVRRAATCAVLSSGYSTCGLDGQNSSRFVPRLPPAGLLTFADLDSFALPRLRTTKRVAHDSEHKFGRSRAAGCWISRMVSDNAGARCLWCTPPLAYSSR